MRSGTNALPDQPLIVMNKEDRDSVSSVVPCDSKRDNGQKLKYSKLHFNRSIKKLCEGGQTLKQVTQRGCRVTIFENIEKPTVVLVSLI